MVFCSDFDYIFVVSFCFVNIIFCPMEHVLLYFKNGKLMTGHVHKPVTGYQALKGKHKHAQNISQCCINLRFRTLRIVFKILHKKRVGNAWERDNGSKFVKLLILATKTLARLVTERYETCGLVLAIVWHIE